MHAKRVRVVGLALFGLALAAMAVYTATLAHDLEQAAYPIAAGIGAAVSLTLAVLFGTGILKSRK